MLEIVFLIIAYLVGSIPTGYLFCRYVFGIDVTKHGSGNIGATNVARTTGHKKFFLLILFIDALKAYLVLLVGQSANLSQDILFALAITLLVGNAYSIFLKFKGGKGVATSLGILFYFLQSWLILTAAITWTLLLLVTKQVFIASLITPWVILILMFLSPKSDLLAITCIIFVCLWLLLRHKNNLINFYKSIRTKS
jgi:glycerol-3-phosphate acyltransferase PlsY